MSGSNLDRLEAAYQAWHDSKARNSGVWFDLLSDEVDFRSCGIEDRAALAFAGTYKTRQQIVAYFTGLDAHWTMVHFTPHTFVVDGDRIAMFGRCAYTSKATAKSCEIAVAHLWRFDNGKAVEVHEVFDSARALAAAQA